MAEGDIKTSTESSNEMQGLDVIVLSLEEDYVHCVEFDKYKHARGIDPDDSIVLKRSSLVDEFIRSNDIKTKNVIRVSGKNCGVDRKLLDVSSIEDMVLRL